MPKREKRGGQNIIGHHIRVPEIKQKNDNVEETRLWGKILSKIESNIILYFTYITKNLQPKANLMFQFSILKHDIIFYNFLSSSLLFF